MRWPFKAHTGPYWTLLDKVSMQMANMITLKDSYTSLVDLIGQGQYGKDTGDNLVGFIQVLNGPHWTRLIWKGHMRWSFRFTQVLIGPHWTSLDKVSLQMANMITLKGSCKSLLDLIGSCWGPHWFIEDHIGWGRMKGSRNHVIGPHWSMLEKISSVGMQEYKCAHYTSYSV